MKKVLGLIAAVLLLITFLAPSAEASNYSLKNKTLLLPNMYNKTVAKQLKNGSYSYYGIKLGMTKKALYQSWGPAYSESIHKYGGETDGMYLYGRNFEVSVSASYKSTKVSTNNLKIDYISLSDNKRKYEYSKVRSIFGKPASTFTMDGYKSEDYGMDLTVTYKKSGSKWYVNEITYTKYDF